MFGNILLVAVALLAYFTILVAVWSWREKRKNAPLWEIVRRNEAALAERMQQRPVLNERTGYYEYPEHPHG